MPHDDDWVEMHELNERIDSALYDKEASKKLYREMRANGCTREQMLELTRKCSCAGCLHPMHGRCQCGQQCNCRCTLPHVAEARLVRLSDEEGYINEVLAEPT